jgi:hypothetical protein
MQEALLSSPTVVSAIIGLCIIVIVTLLRDQLGETKADRLLKVMRASTETARLVTEAANIAVVEVEKSLKKAEGMTDEELKQSAVALARNILENWGVYVDEDMISMLFATIEAAYQGLKARTQFHSLPADA